MSDTLSQAPDQHTDQVGTYRILAVAALAVPLLLFAIVSWQNYDNVLREVELDVRRTADIFHQHALNVFDTHELVAGRVNDRIRGMSWAQIGWSESIRGYLQGIEANYPQVQAIWLADASGVVRNASKPLPASPVSVADRDYFLALREADTGTFVGQTVQARVLKGLNFNIARRRESGTGAFDGVIIVTVFPSYFTSFWNRVVQDKDAAVSLVRKDGALLARVPGLDPNYLTLRPSSPLLRAIHADERGQFRGVSTVDGIERIYAYRKLGKFDAYLGYGTALQSALKPWRNRLLFSGLLFGLAAASLFLLALEALRRTRKEQQAIRHWQDTAQQLAQEIQRRATAEQALREESVALEEANLRLKEIDRLKSILIASVSHELRTPLNSIVGYTGVVLQGMAGGISEEQRKHLTVVKESAAHLLALIEDLLDLGRIEAGMADLAITDFDFAELARQVLDSFQVEAGVNRLELKFECPDTLPMKSDRTRIRQILTNLIGNAVKFTDSGIVAVNIRESENGAEIAVADTGPGIRTGDFGKLFGAFARIDTSGRQGSGLGLYLSGKIAELLGGRIAVRSEQGRGSVFSVWLPLHSRKPSRP